MGFIQVRNVTKEFKIYKQPKGFISTVKTLFNREYDIKRAVDDLSFQIDKGELVGYIGPNGAGKSTTIKMLAGILLPSAGEIMVDGRIPYKNRKENAMRIGTVFGQRSQLYWDLPMEETFDLYRKIYRIEKATYQRNKEFYVELLDIKDFLRMPVRLLSLGQRMRGEIVLSLLHDPDIVYFDEPTIGLDLIAKSKIRDFIREVNKERKVTVILTTHDMDDIEQICNRIITIDKGKIVYDGSLQEFKDKYSAGYLLIVDFKTDEVNLVDPRLKIIQVDGSKKWIRFRQEEISVAEAMTLITKNYDILDLSLKEPEIEEAVREIYGNS